MKRILLTAAALLAALPAQAGTYHVRPGGSDAAAGTSFAAGWASIAKANTALRPGDVCFVYNKFGRWDAFPNPDSAGSNPAGGGRITFIGAFNAGSLEKDCLTDSSARANVTLPPGTISRSYVSVKGFRITGDFTFAAYARACSLASCEITGGVTALSAPYSTIDDCVIGGQQINLAGANAYNAQGFRFTRNRAYTLGRRYDRNGAILNLGRHDSLTFNHNRLFLTLDSNLGSAGVGGQLSFVKRSTFKYNRFEWRTPNEVPRQLWSQRDSCLSNTFVADTFMVATTTPGIFKLEQDAQHANSTASSTMDSCYLFNATGAGWESNQQSRSWTFTNNVVVSKESALRMQEPRGCTIMGNTFVSSASLGTVVLCYGGGTFNTDTTKFQNNIVYQAAGEGVDGTSHRSGLHVGTSTNLALLNSNWNVYSVYPHHSKRADRSISHWEDGIKFSVPRDTTTAWALAFPTVKRLNADAYSTFGPPVFARGAADTSISTSFDARIGYSSAARAAGKSALVDAGAIAYVNQPRLALSAFSVALRADSSRSDVKQVYVSNAGNDSLIVTFTKSSAEIALNKTMMRLAQAKSDTLQITFTAADNAAKASNVLLATNDPSRPTPTIYLTLNALGSGEPDNEGLRRP